MTDDRIVLPLTRVEAVARIVCGVTCGPWEHDSVCLMPDLNRRQRLLDTAVVGLTPDCRDGKHPACVGCLCDCHRHSRRAA